MSGDAITRPDIPPAPEDQPAAQAVCEHFYASHCYRGMYIRLCMTCHEPDWDDLERQQRESVAEHERTEQAEAKVAALEDALRRHTLSFADPKGGGELCGGCLRPSPCPDAALCSPEATP